MTPRGRLKKAKRCCARRFLFLIYIHPTHTHKIHVGSETVYIENLKCMVEIDLLNLLWEMKGKIQDIRSYGMQMVHLQP